jgi:hypothetical protein
MLAGVYLCVEAEEDFTVRPCKPPEAASPLANGSSPPTPDQLAGVFLPVEAAEDLAVYPARQRA